MSRRALDLVNAGPEDVGAPDAWITWLTGVGALGAEEAARLRRSPPATRLLIGEALFLRAAIEELATALSEGRPPGGLTLHALDRVLAADAPRRRLVAGPGGYAVEERSGGQTPLGLLVPFALDAAELLADADPRRLRRCAAEGCRLWFLDTSRNGKRRWCSMERCGNRAKARRHYRRSKAEGSGGS